MLTKKQIIYYQQTWSKYAQVMGWVGMPAKDLRVIRHDFLASALGSEKSAAAMTNKELDKVLAIMNAAINPSALGPQLRAVNGERNRALHSIKESTRFLDEQFGEEYTRKIRRDRFGGRCDERLSDTECSQLAMTLNNRRKAIKMSVCEPEMAPERVAQEQPF